LVDFNAIRSLYEKSHHYIMVGVAEWP
jgi:hypothetical protein